MRLTVHWKSERFGPLPNPTCMAFDSYNSIVAIASSHKGVIKLYGRPGAETTLYSPKPLEKATILEFVHETGHLVAAVDKILEVWNLGSLQLQHKIELESQITCVTNPPNCSFLYVGMKNGTVVIINSENWSKSLYKIELKDAELPPGGTTNAAIVGVLVNPDRDDIILIGYACGAINEWDIKARKVNHRYFGTVPLSSMSWDPTGNKILAGHANGDIVLWQRKKMIADATYPSLPNQQKATPIRKIHWLPLQKNDSIIVSLGGTDDASGIVIEKYKSSLRYFVPLTKKNCQVRDIAFVYDKATNTTSPFAIACLDSEGCINITRIPSEIDDSSKNPAPASSLFVPLPHPLPFNLHDSPIISSHFFRAPPSFLQELVQCCNVTPPSQWPLTGGLFKIDKHDAVLFMSLHLNRTIIIWDMSSRGAKVPLYKIDVPCEPLQIGDIATFDFCPTSRRLHIAIAKTIYVFNFCLESKDGILASMDEKAPSSPAAPQSVTEALSPSKSATSTTAPPSTTVPNGPHQTESESSQETPNSESSSTATARQQVTPASRTQQDATQIPPSSQELPHPESISSKSSSKELNNKQQLTATPSKSKMTAPHTVQKGTSLSIPMPTQPPGFHYTHSITLDSKPIQAIKFESGLGLLAVSTMDGKVRILNSNADYLKTYVYCPPANTMPCPPIATHLQLCEAVIANEDHLILVMGMDLGNVVPISLTNPSTLLKYVNPRKSAVIDIRIVATRGNQLILSKKPWISPNAASPDQQADSISKYKYQSTHKEEKFLLICTVNDIRTYSIPDFEMVSQVECPAPVSWFGTTSAPVTVDGSTITEYALVAIDMASNVLMYKLMNLAPMTPKTNLLKMGVEGISPISSKNSCILEDGSLVLLFSDQSEIHVARLRPIEDSRSKVQMLCSEAPKDNTAKKSKGLRSLIGKDKDVNFEEVFGPRKIETEIASPSTTPSKTPNAPPKPAPSVKATKVNAQTNEIADTMNENLRLLNERSDKLKDVAERSQQLADDSANFASMARQLSAATKKQSSWF